MSTLKTVITIIYVIICVALTVIVLSQEGKSASLTSSITGGGYDNSYWSKNKGNSKDAVLKKITTVLGILFIFVALLLDSKLFQ